MTDSPYLSIIIPTFQREQVLIATIQSVLDQKHSSFEIIVVDQSRDHEPATKRALIAYRRRGEIVYLRERIASLPRARNVGAANARGEIFVFIDDDVILTKNYLSYITKAFNDTHLDAMTGRIMVPGEAELDLRPFPINHKKAAERLDLPICVYTGVLHQPAHFFGGNCAIRRDAYYFAGGFNHHFSRSALGEDIEFNGRLQRLGGRVRYDSRMALWHLSEAAGGCRLDATKEYRRHRDRLRCYYYALLNGLGIRRSLPIIKRRFQKKTTAAEVTSRQATGPTVSTSVKLRRAAGRFIGASLGIFDALTKRRLYGNLADIYYKSKRLDGKSFDVVIPTYERAKDVQRTVEQFLAYRHSFQKLIIVDQSTIANAGLLAIQEQHGDQVLYVQEKIAGASRARNIGAALSTADYLLFVDDDISLVDNLIKSHLSRLRNTALLGGRIAWTEDAAKHPVPYPENIKQDIDKWEAPICYYGTEVRNSLHLITCNMSMLRDIVAMCGGFHEWYRGGGEDLDFVQRVRRFKFPVNYHPRPVVIHHGQDSGGTRSLSGNIFLRLYRKHLAFLVSVVRCGGSFAIVGYLHRRLRNQLRRSSSKQMPSHQRPSSKPTSSRWLLKTIEWIAIGSAIPFALAIAYRMNRQPESYLATARAQRKMLP